LLAKLLPLRFNANISSNNVEKIILIVLFLITTLLYIPTFFNDWQMDWDDQWAILGNPFILNPNIDSLKTLFTTFYYEQYAPFNVLFYFVLFKLFGFNAGVFHAACLMIHLANVALVYKIVRELLQNLRSHYSIMRVLSFAFFTSLIFAIHPLQVESVAWNSASKIVLYAFCYLICVLLYLKQIKVKRTNSVIYKIYISLLFIIALGFKEQAIILPFTFFAIDYVFGRIRFPNYPLNSRIILEKLPYIIIALAYWAFSAQFEVGSLVLKDSYALQERLLFGMQSMCEYVFRYLAPVKLFYFYPFPYEKGGIPNLSIYSNVIFFIIIIIFFIYNFKRKNKIFVFGFLFFLINISLVLHIIPVPRRFITADRYMYISIIGASISFWWIILYILKKSPQLKIPVYSLVVIYCLFLSIKTVNRVGDWKNSRTLKENVNELINNKLEKGKEEDMK
tara:strand:+ start:4645 stop:5994 length:1350 start_codon:yes stop_codon:yes gene_type:complete